MFAGVAGGLADFVGVDPTVVRVAFVILAIFGGVGIPLYLVAWAGLPTRSMPESHAERWFRGSPNPAAFVALAVGFVILLNVLHAGPGDGIGWGLALLFGGWLLFRADSRAVAATGTVPPPTDAATWSPPGAWHGPGGGAGTAATTPIYQRRPPRPRSILGRLTFGLVLAGVGVAALLDQLGVVAVEPVQYAAVAMTITGLGLIVGAWIGHAYWLIGLGVVLLPVMLVASLPPLSLEAGSGELEYRPNSAAEVQDKYELGAGELLIDLSGVDFPASTTRIDISMGLGATEIIVPPDVTVAVDGEMRIGRTELFGNTTVGQPFLDDITDIDEGTGAGRLELSIDNGVGELVVRRANEES